MVEDTIRAINKALKLPNLPKKVKDSHRSAMNFKTFRKSPNPPNGCVGALDRLAVQINEPREEVNPAVYYNRKDFYTLCV